MSMPHVPGAACPGYIFVPGAVRPVYFSGPRAACPACQPWVRDGGTFLYRRHPAPCTFLDQGPTSSFSISFIFAAATGFSAKTLQILICGLCVLNNSVYAVCCM